MNAIIAFIEKGRPFFNKLAGNIYLQAIRDGFLTAMPAILFSSIFILCAALPEVFGFVLPAELSSWLWRVYNLTMGVVAILVAATTARSLAESLNRKLPANQSINVISVMLASICGFLTLAVTEIDGGIDITYLGTKGLLCSFISAFLSCNLYKFCMIKNITIKMPPEVPGVISNVFRNVFPFSFSVLGCVLLDLVTTKIFGARFAESVILLFSPFFQAADSYLGLGLIGGAMAFFWFLGIHGPSIVEPAIAAAIYANVEANLMLVQGGEHASIALTAGFQNFIVCFGGTGCTLVVPFLLMWFCKSKQLKAVGQASFLPCIFNVNEPVLFAAPIVLNPYFFVPFLLTPILNAWIFKFFVDVLQMNSFIYVLPWATPAPIAMFLGTGMGWLALALALLLIVVDAVVYLPFVKAYDTSLVEEEAKNREAELEEEKAEKAAQAAPKTIEVAPVSSNQTSEAKAGSEAEMAKAQTIEQTALSSSEDSSMKPLNVLVLCVGAGTSAMFANAVNKGAQEKGLPVTAQAEAFGGHTGILQNFQLVVLSPQVQTRYDEIKADADKYGIKVVKTKGAQYINLTRQPENAVDFVVDEVKKD